MPLYFFAFVFLSEMIGTVAGFGSATILFPFALIFFDFKSALVLVAFTHVFGNISRIGFFKHGFDKNLIIRFGIPAIIFTILGSVLVDKISQNYLLGLLGSFLIGYSLISLFKHKIKVKHNPVIEVVEGGISGFVTGLIGTGGAFRGSFLNSYHLSKEKFIATSAAIALAVDLTRIPIYINQGFLRPEYFLNLPILFLLALIGAYLGKYIVEKISQTTFTKMVLILILLAGIKFVHGFILNI
jgi:uncharacterized membrane protein YfcA